MDTRAQKAADLRAEDAADRKEAQADAMKQSAALHARDAKGGTATIEKEDRVVTTFRGKEIVTREEAEAIVLEEKLEAAEKEVGNDDLWYVIRKVLQPGQILQLLVNWRAAKARAIAEAAPETPAEKEARLERESDETPAEAKARKEREAAAKKADAKAPAVVDRYLHDQIVLWTQSGNRP